MNDSDKQVFEEEEEGTIYKINNLDLVIDIRDMICLLFLSIFFSESRYNDIKSNREMIKDT